jgi:hypothetical protein
MASKLSIQVGALSAERNYSNDAKVSATLLAFYDSFNLGPANATNQQKLLAILDWFAKFMREKAMQQYEETARDEAAIEGAALYGIE